MSRRSRILLIILAIPVVLIIAGIIVLKAMFTSEKLKAMVIPRIEEATHRQVAINDISLVVFPSIGVEMDGFSMENRKGPEFATSPFMTLDRLVVNAKLFPLLKGNVEVNSVVLDNPRILIETDSKGETNYADMKTPPEKKAGQEREQGNLPVFLVSDLRINNGTVDYVSYKDNSASRVRGLNVTMGIEGGGSKVNVAGKASIDSLSYGTVETPLISGLRVGFEPRMVYDMGSDVLTFEKGDLTIQDMALAIAGTISNLKKEMVLNLTIGADNLNIADLLSLVPREYMKKAEGLKGNGTAQVHLAVTGTMTDSTTADVSGKITASGASIQYPKLPKAITNINIVSEFTRSKAKQEFRLDKLTANLGNNPISMAVTVVNFENPSMTMSANGSLNLGEVGQFYPLEQGTELGGSMKANVQVSGKVKDPKSLKGSGTMEFQNVTAKTAASKNPIRNLQGAITFNNETVQAKKISMNIGRSDMALAFLMRNYLSMMSTDKNAPKPTATMTLQANHLYTEDIMGEEGTAEKKPEPGQQVKKKTSLPLPNVVMDVNATINTLTMKKFEFNNVRAAMHIADGVITLQNFTLNAYGGQIASKGTLNLQNPDKPLFNLAVDAKSVMAHGLLSQFTSFGQRIDGALSMSTTMQGALNDTMGLVPNALNGGGKVEIQDGTLQGFKVNQALASSLKLPDLEVVKFKDWANAFSVQGGRVQIKDLKIHALNGDYLVNGSQGLDGTLDYTMTIVLPANLSSKVSLGGVGGELVNLLKDKDGRLALDAKVGGTTDDPKVGVNTDALKAKAEDLAKQKVAGETKKLQDKATEKAGDILKGILKGKKK